MSARWRFPWMRSLWKRRVWIAIVILPSVAWAVVCTSLGVIRKCVLEAVDAWRA